MSTWYEPKKEEMDITEDGKELHVCFDSDYSGAIWISLKVADVKKLFKEFLEKEIDNEKRLR